MPAYHNIAIIHGERPLRDGRQHPDYIKRLNKLVELIREGEPIRAVFITGGSTRINALPEADFGKEYLRKKINIPIIVEDKSRTTIENIKYVKEMVNSGPLSKAYVITSKKRMPRLKFLYKRLWPDLYYKTTFVSSPDKLPSYFYFTEVLCTVYSIFDLNEKFIPKFGKIIFRNG